MSVEDIFISLARQVLESVQSQFMAQLRRVEEAVMNPLRSVVQLVTGGIWIGKGADAFVNEVSSIFIPNVSTICNHITTTNNNVTYARDVIDQADQEVQRLVDSRLGDTFKFY